MRYFAEEALLADPLATLMATLNILYYRYKDPDKIPWEYIQFFFEELEDPPEA